MPGHTHHSINLNKQCLSVYLQAKNQPHPSYFTWDIVKILQTRYFGFFGHAWLRTPKLILSTCRKLLCLSAVKKKNHLQHFSVNIIKIYKFLILGNLGMHGCANPKSYYHLVENFNVYLHAKNELHHSFLYWDITF